jgi:hypothetical protein
MQVEEHEAVLARGLRKQCLVPLGFPSNWWDGLCRVGTKRCRQEGEQGNAQGAAQRARHAGYYDYCGNPDAGRAWPRALSKALFRHWKRRTGTRAGTIPTLLDRPFFRCRLSSVVEQRFCKPLVGSSNLSAGIHYFPGSKNSPARAGPGPAAGSQRAQSGSTLCLSALH